MNLKHILLLLKVKLMILINGFTKGALKKRSRKLVAVVGGGFIFFFIYKWIFEIFSTQTTITKVGSGLIDNSMIAVFLFFFVFLMISGITVSIHYLFISSDLPLLMVSPISNNTIFTFKLIEAMFANSTLFFFMGIPIFIAYGIFSQAHWYYYPLMLINGIFFLAIPISIAFLIALLIVRIIPPQRAREFMAILLGIVSFGIWLVLQIVRASTFDQTSSDFNPNFIISLQQISQNFLINLLPSTWAARSLAGFAHSDLRLIVFNFLPLLIFVICIFTICIQLSQNAFKQGFISSEQSVTLRRKKKVKQSVIADLPDTQSFRFGVTGSVFVRDLKLLFRDTRQLVSILMFAVMMVMLPLLHEQKELDAEFAAYYPYIFILFFSSIISGTTSSRLVPLEGKSFWITKLLPQPPIRLVLGKTLLGFAISIIVTWCAVTIIGIYLHHQLHVVMLALIVTLCYASAFSSIGVLVGMYLAKFDWDHPKRMLSQASGFILSISALLISGIVIFVYVIGLKIQISIESLNILAVSLTFILSIIIVIAANLLAAKKLEKMEWKF